jgi:hypothetical protein
LNNFFFIEKISTRYKQCLDETTCHCGLYINQEKLHNVYIDFCDKNAKEEEESLFYENNFELRYYKSDTKLNARVNCMNDISIGNIDEIENEWLNVSSNIDNHMFKCARILNDVTPSSSFLIRINALVNVRFDIGFVSGKRVLGEIGVQINNEKAKNENSNFGGLCGNFEENTCDNYLEDADTCENNANVLYGYWK